LLVDERGARLVVTDLSLEVVMTATARSQSLLVAGAALGVVLAACGLLVSRQNRARAIGDAVVATVNGQPISATTYRRALAGLANDRRDDVTPSDRRRVLQRLVDEELLVQRGLELGLARSDRRVRGDLSSAVIAAVLAGRRDAAPSAADVDAFFVAHRDTFASPGLLHVQQIFFRVSESSREIATSDRAREATRRARAGESFAALRAELGDAEISPLPDTALPPGKLLDYLGPTALRAALALGVGEVSEPVRSGQGVHVLRLVERQDAGARPLEDVRAEATAELTRRRDEEALRGALDGLRAAARIEVREDEL
jgi:parvulin-like peptidyl-prolyl isomerase